MTSISEVHARHHITVYTKPGCVQCHATLRALQRAALDFTAVDITTDPQALDFVMSMGYVAAPVVTWGSRHWSGYRPDRIAELADGAA
jgi:glutaredoxin-like protein NrdH